jgi:hypothetical protein
MEMEQIEINLISSNKESQRSILIPLSNDLIKKLNEEGLCNSAGNFEIDLDKGKLFQQKIVFLLQ